MLAARKPTCVGHIHAYHGLVQFFLIPHGAKPHVLMFVDNESANTPCISYSPFRKSEDSFVTELTLLEYVKGGGFHARISFRLLASIRATERERDTIDDEPESDGFI